MNLPDWLTPVAPDAPSSVLLDADGGGVVGGGTETRRGGVTDWTPERVAAAEETERQHQAWLATEGGVAWFNAQPHNSYLPLVRVRRLGLQQHPDGSAFMLYNTVSGYVLNGKDAGPGCTVTLASLVKQGYRVEVVK